MFDGIIPQAGTENHSAAIQAAIEEAVRRDQRQVCIPEGDWYLEAPIVLPEQFHLHLDGARLIWKGEGAAYLLQNSVIHTPRALTKYGKQRGITVTGERGAGFFGSSGIYFYNVGDFTVKGLVFDCEEGNGLTLVYCEHGRIGALEFCSCKVGVEVCIGTANCFFYQITGKAAQNLLSMDSRERQEMVYYQNPQVKNHIVRRVSGEAGEYLIRLEGKDCEDVILEDVENFGSAESGVWIQDAQGVTLKKIAFK